MPNISNGSVMMLSLCFIHLFCLPGWLDSSLYILPMDWPHLSTEDQFRYRDVTRFHSSSADTLVRKATDHNKEERATISLLLPFIHPSVCLSIPSPPWWTRIIGHVINFTGAAECKSTLSCLKPCVSSPSQKATSPDTHLLPGSGLYYRAADTFLMVTTQTSRWTQSTDSQMRGRVSRGRVKISLAVGSSSHTQATIHTYTHLSFFFGAVKSYSLSGDRISL